MASIEEELAAKKSKRNFLDRFFDPLKEQRDLKAFQEAEANRLNLQKLRQEIESKKARFSTADLFDPAGEKEEPREPRASVQELFRTAGVTKPNRIDPRIAAPTERIPKDTPMFTRSEAAARLHPKPSSAQPRLTFTAPQAKAIIGTSLKDLIISFDGNVPPSAMNSFLVNNKLTTGIEPSTGDIFGRRPGSSSAQRITLPADPPPLKKGELRKFVNFSPKNQDRVLVESDKFQKDKTIMNLEERLSKATEIDKLSSANPKNAFGLLAGAFTRLSGEVGRLTDEDIKRNITPKGLVSRLIQALKLAKDSKFPQMRIDEMAIILDIAQKSAVENFNIKADNATARMMLIIPNADPENVKQIIAGRSLLYDPSLQYSKQVLGGGDALFGDEVKDLDKQMEAIFKKHPELRGQ